MFDAPNLSEVGVASSSDSVRKRERIAIFLLLAKAKLIS
jgi:hypothetical protein